MTAETLPVLAAHIVTARRGADDQRDAGIRLAPKDASATLDRLIQVLLDRPDLRREFFVLLHVANVTRQRMARAVLAEHPYLHDALVDTYLGPEARQLAREILDVAPGQCLIDRHCRMGEDHDGGCLPGGE
jgi:hypothetical protein